MLITNLENGGFERASGSLQNHGNSPTSAGLKAIIHSIDEEVKPKIFRYRKGEIVSKDIQLKDGEELGAGASGVVSILKNDSRFVVKKGYRRYKKICRLEEEYNIGISLNHRSLVRFYELLIKEYADGTEKHKIKMELVSGKTLKSFRLWEKNLTLDQSITAINDSIDCLAYLYSQKVAWNDLQDTNVMIDVNNQIKFIDLGAYKRISDPFRGLDLLFQGLSELNDSLLLITDPSLKNNHLEMKDALNEAINKVRSPSVHSGSNLDPDIFLSECLSSFANFFKKN